jgi:NADPH-dependent 2,4-dienoyl-CoA reductase/sulfur reductase-like enzyme
MAENLREKSMKVSLVEAAPHILPPFDDDMAVIVEKELSDGGVGVYLNDGVKEFRSRTDGIDVVLSSGDVLKTELVILSIGVRPDTGFLQNSGIELGEKGHILVNEYHGNEY